MTQRDLETALEAVLIVLLGDIFVDTSENQEELSPVVTDYIRTF